MSDEFGSAVGAHEAEAPRWVTVAPGPQMSVDWDSWVVELHARDSGGDQLIASTSLLTLAVDSMNHTPEPFLEELFASQGDEPLGLRADLPTPTSGSQLVYIRHFLVRFEWRRHGLGTELLSTALAECAPQPHIVGLIPVPDDAGDEHRPPVDPTDPQQIAEVQAYWRSLGFAPYGDPDSTTGLQTWIRLDAHELIDPMHTASRVPPL